MKKFDNTPGGTRRHITAITQRTLKQMGEGAKLAIHHLLTNVPDLRLNNERDSAAFRVMLKAEDEQRIDVMRVISCLLRTDIFRALREEHVVLEKNGLPALVSQTLMYARCYAAGKIAGKTEGRRETAQNYKLIVDELKVALAEHEGQPS